MFRSRALAHIARFALRSLAASAAGGSRRPSPRSSNVRSRACGSMCRTQRSGGKDRAESSEAPTRKAPCNCILQGARVVAYFELSLKVSKHRYARARALALRASKELARFYATSKENIHLKDGVCSLLRGAG